MRHTKLIMKTLFVVFSVVLLKLATATPLESDTNQWEVKEDELNYLVRYGYLKENGIKTQTEVTEAIETFQRFAHIPVTGVVDEATKKMMQAPRCGFPDVVQNMPRYVLHPGGGWKKRDISYYVRNVTHKLNDPERVADILQFALDRWGKWARLRFTRKYDNSADIIAFFAAGEHGDGYPFDGRGNVLAHAFFPGPGIGGDIHYDDDEDWVFPENVNDGSDIYTVSIHELGHSLGLRHSDVESAIMFPWYKPTPMDQELDRDDILGIRELYKNLP